MGLNDNVANLAVDPPTDVGSVNIVTSDQAKVRRAQIKRDHSRSVAGCNCRPGCREWCGVV